MGCEKVGERIGEMVGERVGGGARVVAGRGWEKCYSAEWDILPSSTVAILSSWL